MKFRDINWEFASHPKAAYNYEQSATKKRFVRLQQRAECVSIRYSVASKLSQFVVDMLFIVSSCFHSRLSPWITF